MNLTVLHIDDKWSVEYDSTNNDRPVNLLRYGKRMTFSPQDWDNPSMSMFYALLDNSISVKHLKSNNAKVVKLLARLGTWIEDEVGAELPFTTDDELELYRSVVR